VRGRVQILAAAIARVVVKPGSSLAMYPVEAM
jgi:hypothetical protein